MLQTFFPTFFKVNKINYIILSLKLRKYVQLYIVMVSHHRATAEIHCLCSGFKIYTITQRIYDYSIFIYSILAVYY